MCVTVCMCLYLRVYLFSSSATFLSLSRLVSSFCFVCSIHGFTNEFM